MVPHPSLNAIRKLVLARPNRRYFCGECIRHEVANSSMQELRKLPAEKGERSISGAGGRSIMVRRAENRPAVPPINDLRRMCERENAGRRSPSTRNGPLSVGWEALAMQAFATTDERICAEIENFSFARRWPAR